MKGASTTKQLVATVFVLAGFAALASTGTSALFTDQQAVGANTFTSGTIDISVTPASSAITFTDMMPGDTVTDDLLVTNVTGSSNLRYAVSSSATNTDAKGLKDQLVLTVKTIDVTTPGTPCDNFDGTQLYTGDLDSTAGKIIGDTAQGAQAGDRTLNSSTNETLCFRVTLPSTTPNAYAGSTTTATFTFAAEQTKNNP
jgi:predicted ribosomally synthesized peptide with SipW-like signal peptide